MCFAMFEKYLDYLRQFYIPNVRTNKTKCLGDESSLKNINSNCTRFNFEKVIIIIYIIFNVCLKNAALDMQILVIDTKISANGST